MAGFCTAMSAMAAARDAHAQPCYGALGATQTERRAAAEDRTRGAYAGRDQRYAAGAEAALRMRMRQRGCNRRDKARDFDCQRLAGQIAAARSQTRAFARSGINLDRSADYHDDRARRFSDDYTRCGGTLRP